MSIYFHDKVEKANFERQVKSLRDENNGLNQQLTRVQSEKDTIKKDFTELQTKNVKVETELKIVKHKMEQQLDQMNASNAKELQNLQNLRDVRVKITILQNELQKLKEKDRETKRNSQVIKNNDSKSKLDRIILPLIMFLS